MKKLLLISTAVLGLTVAHGQINPTNNFIAVDLGLPENPSFTYDSATIMGKNMGMTQVGINLLWTMLETSPNTYDFTYLDIANIYYPAYSLSVDLTIAPINTNVLEMPSDISSLAFDNPIVINRFKKLLDSVKVHIPSLQLSSLVIGSEVDGYLSTSTEWTQYTNFYSSVTAYAKILWPGLKVACEAQFEGLTVSSKIYWQQLNSYSDYIGVSYYPLKNDFTVKPVSSVAVDFDTIVSQYPSKPICFYQYGYPSGALCNSSQTQQAQFITQTFTSWDTYASNIRMIDFTWLHDMDSASVNYYSTYYGITDTIFLEYLGTLGLRTWFGMGVDKLALKELRCQAKQRGYNTLPINCSSGITDVNKDNSIIVFPNPFISAVTINSEMKNCSIKIMDVTGNTVRSFSNVNKFPFTIERSNLSSGMYFLELKSDNRIERIKLII